MKRKLTEQEKLIEKLYSTAVVVHCWHDMYGNPTYKVYTADQSFTFVDDYYICRGYFKKCEVTEVKRKKDL